MARPKPLAVLDTCVIIDALTADDASPVDLNQRAHALDVLAELEKTHRLAIPAAVIAELGCGHPEPVFREILSAIPEMLVLALDAQAAIAAGPLRARARPKAKDERRFQDYDALIAGTALANGAAVLVTSNIADFQKLLQDEDLELRNHLGQPTNKGAQLKLLPTGSSTATPSTKTRAKRSDDPT